MMDGMVRNRVNADAKGENGQDVYDGRWQDGQDGRMGALDGMR